MLGLWRVPGVWWRLFLINVFRTARKFLAVARILLFLLAVIARHDCIPNLLVMDASKFSQVMLKPCNQRAC